MLQCVAVCCSVLQRGSVSRVWLVFYQSLGIVRVLQHVAVCCRVLQCVAAWFSLEGVACVVSIARYCQGVAACCSMLQHVAVCCVSPSIQLYNISTFAQESSTKIELILEGVARVVSIAWCCQDIAVCCSVLQCVAVCCSVLHVSINPALCSINFQRVAVCCQMM